MKLLVVISMVVWVALVAPIWFASILFLGMLFFTPFTLIVMIGAWLTILMSGGTLGLLLTMTLAMTCVVALSGYLKSSLNIPQAI